MRVGKPGSKSTVPVRRRKTVVLSADAIRRLSAAAAALDCDESAIVEQLVNDHLSGYSVHVRGKRLEVRGRSVASGEGNPPALAAG